MDNQFQVNRNSQMELGVIYFWTATINNWMQLLASDNFKNMIIDSLRFLSHDNKIDVFAFVIMPNHIHLIWRLNSYNGKESPHVSFLKHTAHQFKKELRADGNPELEKYKVDAANKEYQFWQRDSLAIPIYSREFALQKLNYIHHNPVAKHWTLADDFTDYKYSSAAFYEKNEMHFDFLKWIWDEI